MMMPSPKHGTPRLPKDAAADDDLWDQPNGMTDGLGIYSNMVEHACPSVDRSTK